MAGVARLGARKRRVSRNSKQIARRIRSSCMTRSGIPRDIPLTPRNYEVTTIAPTGTISLVAETSSGIEPNFSWAYVRQDTLGTRTYVHTLAAEALGIEVDQTDEESIKAAAEYVVEHEDELPPTFHLGDEDQIDRARQGPRRGTEARRQLDLKNLQRRERRHGRIGRRTLSPRPQARLQGRQLLPRRQPRGPGVEHDEVRRPRSPDRSQGRRPTARLPAKTNLRTWNLRNSEPAESSVRASCRARPGGFRSRIRISTSP